MKAELCPVCRGSGRYPNKVKDNSNFFGNPQPSLTNPNANPKQKEQFQDRQCHGCSGKGYILIPSDDHSDYYPPPFYPSKPKPPYDDPFGPNLPYRIGDPPRRRWDRFGGGRIMCKGYKIGKS